MIRRLFPYHLIKPAIEFTRTDPTGCLEEVVLPSFSARGGSASGGNVKKLPLSKTLCCSSVLSLRNEHVSRENTCRIEKCDKFWNVYRKIKCYIPAGRAG